ncbi:recombinase family protein [Bdellovibrio sp. HCB337]|uniref:recombinase family protein n=1 Tax=Bdellovibrio sp. HCB337 TaxID=3394358 RepID=UPI0039A4F1F8
MRVATYSRVSTLHHDQKPEVQISELVTFCEARGWPIEHQIVDHGFSGSTDNRPGLKRLIALARGKEINVIVVVKLDRLFRSLKHLVSTLEELEQLGVQFISIRDQIDMTTATGRLMLHIVAAFGEFERGLIRERTIAGLVHAKANGQKLGRPQVHNKEEIVRLRLEGMTYREISKAMNVSIGTIANALKDVHKTSIKG